MDRICRNILILVFVGLVSPVDSRPQNAPATNDVIFQKLMDRLAGDVIEHLNLSPKKRVSVRILHTNDPARSFLMDSFYRRLLNAGTDIMFKEPLSRPDYALQVNIIAFYVHYDGIYRKFPWSRGRIKRQAGIIMTCRIVEKEENRLTGVEEWHEQAEDTIAWRDIGIIERGSLIGGHPERPGERSLRRWVEPVLVAGALAGLSYAFYSVRSQ